MTRRSSFRYPDAGMSDVERALTSQQKRPKALHYGRRKGGAAAIGQAKARSDQAAAIRAGEAPLPLLEDEDGEPVRLTGEPSLPRTRWQDEWSDTP